jgi:2'-5' RNA ligase
MRLFAGIPLAAMASDRLASLRLRLSAPGDGLRWSAPEQWHITLQFYGEVSEERATLLSHTLGEIVASPPEIVLDSLGSFPTKGILHSVVELTPTLRDLQEKVVEASRQCGILPESRPFRPHITMARSKGKSGNASLRRLGTPALPSLGPELRWSAPEFLLYESVLRPQGAQYSVYSRFPLVEADGAGAGA